MPCDVHLVYICGGEKHMSGHAGGMTISHSTIFMKYAVLCRFKDNQVYVNPVHRLNAQKFRSG